MFSKSKKTWTLQGCSKAVMLVSIAMLIFLGVVACSELITTSISGEDTSIMQTHSQNNYNDPGEENEEVAMTWVLKLEENQNTRSNVSFEDMLDEFIATHSVNGVVDVDLLSTFILENIGDYDNDDDGDMNIPYGSVTYKLVNTSKGIVCIKIVRQ
ncbi:MAG: hypothetical protein FWG98_10310 [Candidatus Cloacimonetes bacterium]|nr:hypothetical protein [Candidatus Cloacimonadota bacterium]